MHREEEEFTMTVRLISDWKAISQVLRFVQAATLNINASNKNICFYLIDTN
jgi:hypothetical protein